jgi:thioesterase domain-containing protein/acyl carrier protein
MATQPTSAMAEALTPIWERVLQHSPIGPDDNFFDLGGESLSAVALFLEVEKLCGRQLPSVMIYNTPTIAALAAELERPSTSRLPPLVLLREGFAGTPVFIAHGLGGSVIDFYRLLTHIQCDCAVYGMQARGIDGIDEPFSSIEEMAQYHLEAIKKIQPHGPYIFVGYSLGGLVCLEIARRLQETGEKIALLTVLDAYPSRTLLSLSQRLRLFLRVTFKRFAAAIGMASAENKSSTSEELRAQMSAGRGSVKLAQSAATASMTPAMARAAEIAREAIKRYRPAYYPGTMRFVRAAILTDFPADPKAIWSSRVKDFESETVPGDHLGMIAKYPEQLGAVISRHLQEVTSSK